MTTEAVYDRKAARQAGLRDRTILLVYGTILIVGVSYGLVTSIISVFLKDERGFNKAATGDLAVWFAAGIVAFALPAGWLVKKMSAKTVLLVSLLGYSGAVGAFPFVNTFAAMAGLRWLDGACSVCVWVASETVLLSRAPREEKAFFMSLYAMALGLGYVIGPVASRGVVAIASNTTSFHIAGGLGLATALIVGVLMKGTHAHEEHDAPGMESVESKSVHLSAAKILWRIKVSCLATFSYGYFQASVVVLLPLYLIEQGMVKEQTILVTAFFALGMLVFVNFAGRWGDRIGHLRTMTILGAVGAATVVSFLFVQNPILVYLTSFVAGASLASLSPVSLALMGNVIPAKQLSQSGGFYNAAYALGMLVGPSISSRLFEKVSGFAMLAHFAVLWSVFVLVTLVFRRDDPRVLRSAAGSPLTGSPLTGS